jgi:hypothetical protein
VATCIVIHVATVGNMHCNTRFHLSATCINVHVADMLRGLNPRDWRVRQVYLMHVAMWKRVSCTRVCLSATCINYTRLTGKHVYWDTRGHTATCIRYTCLTCQPRVYYMWLTGKHVYWDTHGTLATCIWWTRGRLCISQQPDLPRRTHVAIYTCLTICHVYGSYTRGNLQVVNCHFFCGIEAGVVVVQMVLPTEFVSLSLPSFKSESSEPLPSIGLSRLATQTTLGTEDHVNQTAKKKALSPIEKNLAEKSPFAKTKLSLGFSTVETCLWECQMFDMKIEEFAADTEEGRKLRYSLETRIVWTIQQSRTSCPQ